MPGNWTTRGRRIGQLEEEESWMLRDIRGGLAALGISLVTCQMVTKSQLSDLDSSICARQVVKTNGVLKDE